MARLTLQEFTNFWAYYRGETHQMDAVGELWRKMPVSLLDSESDWVQKYRSGAEEFKPISVINDAGLALIKAFEGLRLESYICPAGFLTVGYGSTGEHVYPGQVITEKEAEELLRTDLWRFEDVVSCSVTVPLTDNEYAALVSFSFNVGCGAFKDSTLLRRLNDGEPKGRVFAEELPRWDKANGEPLEGLARRRKAEVDLALGSNEPPVFPTKEELPRFTPDASFEQYVTPHVQYGEIALWQDARRFTSQQQCDTALEICEFLEEAREHFGGAPIIITSGYRPPAINAAVGGAESSEHLYDAEDTGAIDWYLDGIGLFGLQDWCLSTWPYSTGKGAPKGFIHTGIRNTRPKIVWNY